MDKEGKADQITLYESAEYLRKNGHRVDEFVIQKSDILSLLLGLLKIFVTRLPLQTVLFWNTTNKKKLKKFLTHKNYDRYYFHLIRTSEYVSFVEADKSYLGMQLSQALNFSRTSIQLPHGIKRIVYSIEAYLCKHYEKRIISKFKKVNFVGTSDPLFLEESQNKKVTTIPHGVDLPSTLAATSIGDLIFLANFSSEPNKIALNHLIFDLFPKIKHAYPDISLTIAGRNIPERILNLNICGLHVLGSVLDANFVVSQHKIFCNPVKASAGMQNKVIGALMSNIPVVTYRTAIEGMEINSPLLRTSELSDNAFVSCLVNLYENYPKASEREAAGAIVQATWSWDALHEKWCTNFLELQNDEGPLQD
ncbi:MAG: glycosyltransferase [Bacteroidetes bacterium]|nr:glycosyltransferase [Bacteroidota bacterium]